MLAAGYPYCGETAEMPGFYPPGEYDLAGFTVGIAERERLVDGSSITAGDTVIGLASSGLHSNGYSLARRVLLGSGDSGPGRLEQVPAGWERSLGEELLRPTRIYVAAVKPLFEQYTIHGAAHITGAWLVVYLPRILGQWLQIVLEKGSWPIPPVFELIREAGPVKREEMYRVFNMGIGFALILPPDQAPAVIDDLSAAGVEAWPIGRVTAGESALVFKD